MKKIVLIGDSIRMGYDKYIQDALNGGKVLSVICKELDISPGEVNLKDFQPEKYAKENIGY